jgi:hypothetical protein
MKTPELKTRSGGAPDTSAFSPKQPWAAIFIHFSAPV